MSQEKDNNYSGNFINPYNINDFYKVFGKCSSCSSCSCDKSDRDEEEDSCLGCDENCKKDYKKNESGGVCRHCGSKDDYAEKGSDEKVCCWKCFDKELEKI